MRDFFCQDLAKPLRSAALAFPPIGNKATFHEDCGAVRFLKHFEFLWFESTISSHQTPPQLALDIAGEEAPGITTRKIQGLRSADAAIAVPVEMQADKDRILLCIGFGGAVLEFNELIASTSKLGSESLGLEDLFQSLCEIEC